MGGLADVIRSAVEAANSQTASLQVDVVHQAWLAPSNGLGEADYGPPVARPALVQEGVLHHEMPDGKVITTKARLAFVGPIPPNGAPDRQEPIDPRDRLILPSGLTGYIVEVPGALIDPGTGAPYVRTVWLA